MLLAHQPRQVRAPTAGVDLQLSGHTHGGQIWPFGCLVRLDQPMLAGLSRHGPRTQLYTSRGTGFWGPPFRIFAPPEITALTLRPAYLEAMGVLGEMFPSRKLRSEAGDAGGGQGWRLGPVDLDKGVVEVHRGEPEPDEDADEPAPDDPSPPLPVNVGPVLDVGPDLEVGTASGIVAGLSLRRPGRVGRHRRTPLDRPHDAATLLPARGTMEP